MRHLIALVKLVGDEFAYHYATDNVDEKAELRSIPQNLRFLFAVHILQTASADFAGVRKWIHILRQLRKSRRFRNLPPDYKNI